MPSSNTSKTNKNSSNDHDDFSSEEGISSPNPSNSGAKGGEVSRDAEVDYDRPMDLVDFLWMHRND